MEVNRSNQAAVNAFSKWLGREATVEDMTHENIELFRNSDALAKILPKTRISYVSAIRSLGGVKPFNPAWEAVAVEGTMTLWGMFEKHYRPRRLIGKAENTTRLYKTTIRKFSLFLGRPAKLTDLTDELVAAHLDELTTHHAMHSVVKEYDQLMALWRFASRRKLVDTYPDLTRPTAAPPVPDAFTVEELKRLLSAASKWEGHYFNAPAALWWECLIRVVYDTGERIGAVLKVEKQHIEREWLMVPATSRKGRTAGKRYKLRATTLELVQKLLELQLEKELFAWPLNYCYFWTIFGKVLDAANLPSDRRGKWHKLRRSVATYYEAAGGNATQLLGHSSRKVTEAYIDTRFINTPQPCDLIEEL